MPREPAEDKPKEDVGIGRRDRDHEWDKGHLLSDGRHDREFREMSERFNKWLEDHGFDRATGLREEVDRIIDRYSLLRGEYNVEEKLRGEWSSSLVDPRDHSDRYRILEKSSTEKSLSPERSVWVDLYIYASDRGFTVTSTTGGNHNKNSLHYKGRAIDIRTRDKAKATVDKFIVNARLHGVRVRDERTRPPGQKVWGGPHVHLDIPLRNSGSQRANTRERDVGTRVQGPQSSVTRSPLEKLYDWLLPSAY